MLEVDVLGELHDDDGKANDGEGPYVFDSIEEGGCLFCNVEIIFIENNEVTILFIDEIGVSFRRKELIILGGEAGRGDLDHHQG